MVKSEEKLRILYVPNEPLEEYERFRQSYNMYPFKYFLPKYFDKVFFSYLTPDKSLTVSYDDKFFVQRFHRFNFFKNKLLNYFAVWDYLKFIWKTRKIIKKNKIDLIRTYNPHVEGFLALIIGKLSGVPVVVSVHNDHYFERASKEQSKVISLVQAFCEFFTLKYADRVFTVSTHLKNEIVTRRKINPDKVKVIFNKVDFARYSSAVPSKSFDKKTFLFIGRFVWQKNIMTMLEAFKKVSNAKLLMVSDGPERPEIEAFIKENNLDVELLGFVPNNDLPGLFKSVDAFILPSLYEGFGIVLIEAQAAGCPIICSDIPSVKDIVNEKNSWLFPPTNVVMLTRLMNNVDRSKVNQGLIDVLKFDWDSLADKEIAYYYELLDRD